MKTNIKKILSTTLCAAMVLTMATGLSSCEKKAEGGTLIWYLDGTIPEDLDTVMAKANEIIEPEIGMKLEMRYLDGYGEKMKLKMASGEEFDLMFTGYNNNYQTAVSLGGLYDITDFVKEQNITDYMPQFYLDAATVNGRIYGLPNMQVVSNPVCISIDKTVADELSLYDEMEAIEKAACSAKNIDDIKAYVALLDNLFAQIKAGRPNLYTINPEYDLLSTPLYEGLTGGLSIRRDGSSDKLEALYDEEITKLSAQKNHEWYEKGYIRNDIASKGNTLTSDEERRQVAITQTTWKPGAEVLLEKTRQDEVVFAMLQNPYVPRTGALAAMTSVSATSKHPEEAVALMKLVSTNEELFNILAWGIEGKHYTKDETGHVTEIENSGYNKIGENAWKLGNQFNAYLVVGQEDGIWEETEKMNNEAVKSPMLGFVPNTDSITTELSNISNVGAEYKARKNFGTMDPAEWYDAYVSDMKAAGVEKVKEELQKQYDEFLASKQ